MGFIRLQAALEAWGSKEGKTPFPQRNKAKSAHWSISEKIKDDLILQPKKPVSEIMIQVVKTLHSKAMKLWGTKNELITQKDGQSNVT